MDPSTPAPASTNAAASSSDQPRNRNRRGAAKGTSDSSSKANKADKGSSKDNHHHQSTRKKESSSAAGTASQPRAPRTIADTDPIDLQAGKTVAAPPATAEALEDDEDRPQCFICTENIVIFAVSDCNHRTCHLCSLRLRALYKTKNCAYCKVSIGETIIFSWCMS